MEERKRERDGGKGCEHVIYLFQRENQHIKLYTEM